ncbi:MAG: DUF3500 domain-containing protein [Planctomycetota bacterium]|nr:DUF3500 domain-containing protein [Planctomycetota bacterium]
MIPASDSRVNRRNFLAVGASTALPWLGSAQRVRAEELIAGKVGTAENAVEHLFASLSEAQRQKICFAWDHMDAERGLLRTHIANNWQISEPEVQSEFYSSEQQALIRKVFEGIIRPDWYPRFDRQLNDDAGGWGHEQSVAIFGTPGTSQFEFVLTGRHMTIRCDGNSADHVAFGGPIFYGHDPGNFNESADHPGNVFWHQAVAANRVYSMLDGSQRKLALASKSPDEKEVPFQGTQGKFSGIAVKELSSDQKSEMQLVLDLLIEPYRQSDRDEVISCLTSQGGLDACHLTFFQEPDIGNDSVWDNWRLEGPSFVWFFRGAPHVHVWVNVADDSSVTLNS